MRTALSFLLLLLGVGCGGQHDPQRALLLDSHPHAYAFVEQGGACSKADRDNYIYRDNRAFAVTWASCGKDSMGDVNRSVQCINKVYPDLSKTCSHCFGAFIGC